MFISIHNDGFTNFSGPWMDYAAGNVITVPVLVHLLLDAKRRTPEKPMPSVTAKGLKEGPVKWSVLDMMGPPLGISDNKYLDSMSAGYIYKKDVIRKSNLSEAEKEKQLKNIDKELSKLPKADNKKVYNTLFDVASMQIDLAPLKSEAVGDLVENSPTAVNKILDIVHNVAGKDALVGSPLYVGIDAKQGKLNLSGSSLHRGVMGYQHMAWFDSNNMIFMLVSVFSTRNIAFMFAAYMMLITILTGIIRQRSKYTFDEAVKKIDNKKLLEEVRNNKNKNDSLYD